MTTISTSLQKKMYEEMLRLRMIEEHIAAIYHVADEIKCPTHLYTGQEAVAVGVCNALEFADTVCMSHRSHGWYIAKGGNLNAMMAELFGKETGCAKGWGGSMHLVDVEKGVMGSSSILAGTISHAVGCALAFKIQGKKNVSVSAFGDAAIEEGAFHESMNWASFKKLPVIFICENNLYSTQTPLKDRQPSVEIYKKAAAYGMPGYRIDGNDVLQVYEYALKAADRARRGEGPTLIEAMTYRWREHVGPNYDYDLGYRSKEELEEWMKRCPIQKLSSLFSKEENKKLQQRFNLEIEESVAFARRSSFPHQEELAHEIL